MVSLIILLLGLFTAGVVVGVFIMALLELKQIEAVTRNTAGTDCGVVPITTDNPVSVKQS